MLTLAFLLAQLQPIQKIGTTCPLNYYTSAGYCVYNSTGLAPRRESIPRTSTTCPLGTHTNGNYCTWSPSY
jgi:hypothetical protein